MISVDLQHEAFRQKILAATRLLSASMAHYGLCREWERGALKDELVTQYVLVRSQVEYALQQQRLLRAGERQPLSCFKDALDEFNQVFHLVRH